MTITYINTVATSKYWTFLRLLLRWKGSIYKIIWFELIIFASFYTGLSCLHRFGLQGSYKKNFEDFCQYCKENVDIIPVPFVLGFYVTLVVGRWWSQFIEIPWPDSMAMYVSAFILGDEEKSIMYRRTIMRYLNLSFCMTFSSISSKAKRMFPDMQSLIDNGLLTKDEEEILNSYETNQSKYFVPMLWATNLVSEACAEKLTIGERGVEALTEEIAKFRGCLGTIYCYDWINPPLVYTQIATISVHTYFLIFIFAEQFIPTSKVDIYVPVFGFLQFVFFMGWLKVAESLINPFGDDDDDFEIDEMIHRNIKISYLIIDEMYDSYPQLDKDIFWNSNQEIKIIQDYKGPKNDMFAGSLLNLNTDDSYIGSKLSIFSSGFFTSMTKLNCVLIDNSNTFSFRLNHPKNRENPIKI